MMLVAVVELYVTVDVPGVNVPAMERGVPEPWMLTVEAAKVRVPVTVMFLVVIISVPTVKVSPDSICKVSLV